MLSENVYTSEMLNTILLGQDLSFIKELESDLNQINLERNFQKEKYDILNGLVDVLNNIIQSNSSISNNFKKSKKNKKQYKKYKKNNKDLLFKQLLLEESNNTISLISSNIKNIDLIENNLTKINNEIISLLSAIENGMFEQEYNENKIANLTTNIDIFSSIFEKTNSEIKINNKVINDFFNRNEEIINSILSPSLSNSNDENDNFTNNSNLNYNITTSNIIEELYNDMVNSKKADFDQNENIDNNNNNISTYNDLENLTNSITNNEFNNYTNIINKKNNQDDIIIDIKNTNNDNDSNVNGSTFISDNTDNNKKTNITFNDTDNIIENNNIDNEESIQNYMNLSIEEKNIYADNLTLIISENDKKVYLPYKVSEVQAYLEQFPGKYNNFEDVINKEFITPLDNYTKHPAVARFRETYSLVRDREYKTISESLKTSLELMFRSDLNPAIIAACKTEDQLENYIDCLEREKLDSFTDFKIEFKVNPLKI